MTQFLTGIRDGARPQFLRYETLLNTAGRIGIPCNQALVGDIQWRCDAWIDDQKYAINKERQLFDRGKVALDKLAALCSQPGRAFPEGLDEVFGSEPPSGLPRGLRTCMQGDPLLEQVADVLVVEEAVRGLKQLKFDASARRHVYTVDTLTGSMTGRPSYRAYLFAKRKCWRQVVRSEGEDQCLIRVDGRSTDVGVAAGLTKDPTLMALYSASDPHWAFGELIRSSSAGRYLRHLEGRRNVWKRAHLAIMYGISAPALAVQLTTTPQVAQRVLIEHYRLFPHYWRAVRRTIENAFNRGYIESPSGWMCHVPRDSNERTWQAWPFQAAAADICRLGYLHLVDAGIPIMATLHDAYYLSVAPAQVERTKAAVLACLDQACDTIMPALRLRWKVTVTEGRLEDGLDDPVWLKVRTLIDTESRR